MAFIATLLTFVLSFYEHQRALRPSSLLLAYLFVTVLFEVAKSRTYWLMPDQPTAGMATANCVVTALLFSLEAMNKTSLLLDDSVEMSSEELSGPISKSFFLWLNGLFHTGYKRSLASADLTPIDGLLYSESISDRFKPLISNNQGKSIHALRLDLGKVHSSLTAGL